MIRFAILAMVLFHLFHCTQSINQSIKNQRHLGNGDYCPSLNEKVTVRFARRDYPLDKKLKQTELKYETWKDADELYDHFKEYGII